VRPFTPQRGGGGGFGFGRGSSSGFGMVGILLSETKSLGSAATVAKASNRNNLHT
jgi:hypothetical protein